MNTALFFVTHGSRDRRSWDSLQDLLTVARSLHDSGALSEPYLNLNLTNQNIVAIDGGCLEGQDQSLAQQIEHFAIVTNHNLSPSQQLHQIIILPLFLLAGVHVQEDIPMQIQIVAAQLAPRGIKLKIHPYIGTHPHIPHIVAQKFTQFTQADQQPDTARLLIAHGSRRAGANASIEKAAQQSKAIVAYWGIEPKIDTQMINLISQGYRKICIVLYFLTRGSITEAIAQKISPYQDQILIEHLGLLLSEQTIIKLSLDSDHHISIT